MPMVRRIFFAGFVMIILPYLGVPSDWKSIISFVLGCWLLYLSYDLYRIGRAGVTTPAGPGTSEVEGSSGDIEKRE